MAIVGYRTLRLTSRHINAATYIKNRTPHRHLDWKTPYEAIHKIKPTYAHMHPYGCRAYALDHKIPRKLNMLPRAHIGYLVGYDSQNIYRIWIPSKKKVIRTRDVTFDHQSFWTDDNLDISDILHESAENVMSILDIPQTNFQEVVEEDDILDVIGSVHELEEKEVGRNKPSSEKYRNANPISLDQYISDTQLNSPRLTPELDVAGIGTNHDEDIAHVITNERPETIPAPSNRSSTRILDGINPENVISGRWTRRNAHSVQQLSRLLGFHHAFSLAIRTPQKVRVYRNILPHAPKSFRQINSHIHSA
ncbi:hypothetical protein K3495_g6860 [Podosphaera aphanis]|nr:hypothetical protein K3495_g6860 [Podosphaera aphanis]